MQYTYDTIEYFSIKNLAHQEFHVVSFCYCTSCNGGKKWAFKLRKILDYFRVPEFVFLIKIAINYGDI